MPQYAINVNTSALIGFTNKLEQMHKSAFPLAVRGTLNAAAFDMKTKTLQESVKDTFIRRSPQFFRKFTAVNKVPNIWDVNRMKAEVGFTPQGVTRAQTPVANMALQEKGGNYAKELNYSKFARGGSFRKMALSQNRFDKENIVPIQAQYRIRSRQIVGTKKSRFIASAYIALREKKLLFFKNRKGQGIEIRVLSMSQDKDTKMFSIETQVIAVNRDHTPIHIKSTNFNEKAARNTVKKMLDFYTLEAEKQFAKVWKK